MKSFNPQSIKTPLERFMEKVDKNGPMHPYDASFGLCWIWIAKSRSISGYGRFWDGEKMVPAHTFLIGPMEEGKIGCHSCDNKLCVNPSHIIKGTHSFNTLDAIAKGRVQIPVGEDASNSKLITEQVCAIRSGALAGISVKELAKRFSISWRTIYDIINRNTWRHI